jgi:hypothetical protein
LGRQQIQQKTSKSESHSEFRAAQLLESSPRRSYPREMLFRDRIEKRDETSDFEKHFFILDNVNINDDGDDNSDKHSAKICRQKDEFFANKNWQENFEI